MKTGKRDVIQDVLDLESNLNDILSGWSEVKYNHLVKEQWRDSHTLIITLPDDDDICFCDTCEQAWLKSADSRCECEEGGDG